MDTNKSEELISLIETELEKCDSKVYPEVCKRSATETGRNEVIRHVVEMIGKEGGTISGVIAQIEQEYEDTYTN